METVEQRAQALSRHFIIKKPDGAGPFPVVLQLHGCGGAKPYMLQWARTFQDAGCVAIVVDSYQHRRIGRLEAYSTICTGLRFWGQERVGDLIAALAWTRRQSWADPKNLFAAGWSHGGWTVLDALAMRYGAEMTRWTKLAHIPRHPWDGLKGVLAFYPYCGRASLVWSRPFAHPVETFALLCGDDSIIGRKEPRRVIERLIAAGAPIDLNWLQTATHAFDEPEAMDMRVRYDPALTRQAHAAAIAFIQKRLAPPLHPAENAAHQLPPERA